MDNSIYSLQDFLYIVRNKNHIAYYRVMPEITTPVGLGDPDAEFNVYIGNVPQMPEYLQLERVQPVARGEIYAIGQNLGNGWRKVFNVYAKLLYTLQQPRFEFSNKAPSWQTYRDQFLLQTGTGTSLLFTPPIQQRNGVHIIMGKTYAKSLIQEHAHLRNLRWHDHEFASCAETRTLVCPYFDYRQLSNVKIARTAEILSGF